MRRTFLRFLPVGGVVLALTSCLSDQDPGEFEFTTSGDDVACAPGRVVSCGCPGSVDGVQTCQSDGNFGPCECSGGAGGSAGSGPSGSCTLFPDCGGCDDCFETCICQSSGDASGCQEKCLGGGGSGGGSTSCDPSACPAPSLPAGSPCCTGGNECGLEISFLGPTCIERDQPGSPDSDCPPIDLMGFSLQGCCKPGGICGVLDSFLGLGCVDPTQFGAPPAEPCG